MGEAPSADKGNTDVAPTKSPRSVCLGDDVSSREQPVHPGITDGLVVAPSREEGHSLHVPVPDLISASRRR